MKHTRKQLLKMPERKIEDIEREYTAVLIVPSGLKHDSGFMKIAVIGVWTKLGKTQYEICAYPDDICWITPSFQRNGYPVGDLRTDCYYPQGVVQFWGNGRFKVGYPTSSLNITFIPNN